MKSDVGSLARPLRGIIPPMVTPLADRDALDVAGLERLVEHILAGGVHGLFILGTMGEAPSLSHRLRHELGSELPQIMLISDNARGAQLVTPDGLDAVAGFADGIGPHKALVEKNPNLVKEAHARGLEVHPWTFRLEAPGTGYESMDEELAHFFFEYGVDGAFTDFPDRAVAVLQRGAP